MKRHTPRRASLTRWLPSAPPCILDCFDSKGPGERYTVFFTGPDFLMHSDRETHVPFLGMSDSPAHPQGVSMWGELTSFQTAAYRYRFGKQRVRWLDLPEHIRAHVIARTKPEEVTP